MRQVSETYHTMEIRIRPDLSWQPMTAGMYRPAILLAYQGRLVEAIEKAQRIRIREYGDMDGIAFRCVTKTTTVTVAAGPIEDAL